MLTLPTVDFPGAATAFHYQFGELLLHLRWLCYDSTWHVQLQHGCPGRKMLQRLHSLGLGRKSKTALYGHLVVRFGSSRLGDVCCWTSYRIIAWFIKWCRRAHVNLPFSGLRVRVRVSGFRGFGVSGFRGFGVSGFRVLGFRV